MQDKVDSLSFNQISQDRPSSDFAVKKVNSVAFNNLTIKSDAARKPTSVIGIIVNFVVRFNPDLERVKTLIGLLRKDQLGRESELDCDMLETAIRTELPHIATFKNLSNSEFNLISKYLARSIAKELKRGATIGHLAVDQIWKLKSKKYAQIVMQSINEATKIIGARGMSYLIKLAKAQSKESKII